jgi:hypothetical protein
MTEKTEKKTEEGFEITFTVSIPEDRVKSLLCTGFEGGVDYWCQIDKYQFAPGLSIEDFREGGEYQQPNNYYHPSEIIPLVPGCAVICSITEPESDEENKPLILDRNALKRGLQIMQEKYQRHWNDFIDHNQDAITGDVFIQCCLLGEIVFG